MLWCPSYVKSALRLLSADVGKLQDDGRFVNIEPRLKLTDSTTSSRSTWHCLSTHVLHSDFIHSCRLSMSRSSARSTAAAGAVSTVSFFLRINVFFSSRSLSAYFLITETTAHRVVIDDVRPTHWSSAASDSRLLVSVSRDFAVASAQPFDRPRGRLFPVRPLGGAASLARIPRAVVSPRRSTACVWRHEAVIVALPGPALVDDLSPIAGTSSRRHCNVNHSDHDESAPVSARWSSTAARTGR